MSSDIILWDGRATITVPVAAMPATFDAEHAGRPTHTTLTVTTAELRALAAAAALAVEKLDHHLAANAGQMIGAV